MSSRKLAITKEKIDRAVILARKYRETFPPDTSPEPRSLADFHNGLNPTDEELAIAELFYDFLLRLSPEEMRELQALMYLGRGDYRPENFWDECDHLSMDDDQEIETNHVLSKSAVLVDYLFEGFSRMNRGGLV